MLIATGLDAVQVRGGYGFTTEYEVERDLRDAVGGTALLRHHRDQRNLIARNLGPQSRRAGRGPRTGARCGDATCSPRPASSRSSYRI